MSPLTQERTVPDKIAAGDACIVGEPFDHTVVYSDAYYEHYTANFVPNKKKRSFYRFIKRTSDIFISGVALVILFPLMLVIGLAIKLDSKGNVIFKQKRVGKNGELFCCYKFRTMRTDSPNECATSQLKDPQQYITKVGRILRKLSLDELPQLWCVFVGTMSLIGYRPLVQSEETCNEMRRRMDVFSFRPGISGSAQVHGRDDVYYKNKAILDAEYVKNASVWLDLKLICKTFVVVLNCEGNDAKNLE